MDDNKIIALYNERNENAIKETETKYGLLLNKIAFEILNSFPDSEECVNTTYLKTWNAIPPTVPKSLRSFICRIARNTALTLLTKLNRHRADDIYEEPDGWCWFDNAFIVNRLALDSETLYHSTYCNHSEGKCYFNNKDYTRTEVEQLNLERKLENLQLTETATKQDVFDYVGEPDSVEELNEDITRLIYNYDDEKIGYICFYNSIGTSPILDCSYTYNFKENDIVYFTGISKSCLSKTYYELYYENAE